MPVPNLNNTLNGWVKKVNVNIVTKSVVDHKIVESAETKKLYINYQPMPAQRVDRKPEEQRSWKWWTIIIKDRKILLKIDDEIEISGKKFKINSISDWRESGFSSYEAIEDFVRV